MVGGRHRGVASRAANMGLVDVVRSLHSGNGSSFADRREKLVREELGLDQEMSVSQGHGETRLCGGSCDASRRSKTPGVFCAAFHRLQTRDQIPNGEMDRQSSTLIGFQSCLNVGLQFFRKVYSFWARL